MYRQSIDAHGSLIPTLNDYLEKTNRENLDVSTECTWTTLKTNMGQTSAALQGALDKRRDTDSFVGKVRKVFSVLCESAALGKVFTSVIPSELGLASSICGGLNVIFSAMEQKAIHERSVRDAIEELPLILRTHEPFAEAAAYDIRIHQETDGLYVAVCHVLQHVVKWLIENSLSNFRPPFQLLSGIVAWIKYSTDKYGVMTESTVKHIFKPKRYAERLGELMAKVRFAAQGLDVCATAIIARNQRESLDLQSKSLFLQERMFLTQGDLGHQMDSMDTKMQQSLQTYDERLQRIEQLQSLQLSLQMGLTSVIACENLQPFLRDRLRSQSPQTPSAMPCV